MRIISRISPSKDPLPEDAYISIALPKPDLNNLAGDISPRPAKDLLGELWRPEKEAESLLKGLAE